MYIIDCTVYIKGIFPSSCFISHSRTDSYCISKAGIGKTERTCIGLFSGLEHDLLKIFQERVPNLIVLSMLDTFFREFKLILNWTKIKFVSKPEKKVFNG